MREISADVIRDNIAALAVEANCKLPCDVKKRIEEARENEPLSLIHI